MRSFFWQLSQSARHSSTNNLCRIISIGGSVRITCIHHHYHGFFLILVTQMVITAVNRFSYSISYAGLDSMHVNQTAQYTSCSFKVANMINKFGTTLSATLDSTQSAVRNKASALIYNSTCPGFGMCADLSDGDEQDVWPIVAITVSSY